jgi:DNA helicase II / ATP-dependent DNA helicase PcrA
MVSVDLFKGLTDEQQKVVTHNEGPSLVVAGAGTGKTTVITRRIAWLIQEKLAKPEEILALTFTEKAASEMLARVDDLSDYIYSGLSISTFHSFGAEIITEFSYELGLAPDVRVLSDAEQILFIRDNIFEFNFKHYQNLGDPTSMISDLVKVFSRAKDEAIDPEVWIKKAKAAKKKATGIAEVEEAEKELEIAEASKKYNQLLRENGYIDYGDQIILLLELLKKPSIAKKIKDRFKYVLVDEFQDTNYAQNELIKEIFGTVGNVMVVGDDDQSIYRFRGASVSNILDFKKTFSNPKTYVLNENFRSTQRILDLTYNFIQNNNPNRLESKYKIDKKLKSSIGPGDEPRLFLFSDESKEVDFIAKEIMAGVKNGHNFSDFAVLVRANNHAEEFILSFKKNGIPYAFSGIAGIYQKIEVKNLISLVSIISDPSDDLALFHLSASEIYGMDMKELALISRLGRRLNKNLLFIFEEIESYVTDLPISDKTFQKAQKIVADLQMLREESRTATAGEIVNVFLRESGYYAKLTKEAKDGSIEAHTKISNIAGFFDRIIHFQKNYRDHSLEKFALYLELMMEIGADAASSDIEDGLEAVSILSMHKAKGLEFETVFVVSLSDSHMPGQNRSSGFELPKYLVRSEVTKSVEAAIEEERRLLYVAMTRAKKNLYLTTSLDYGTKRTHKASRFLVEIFGKEGIEQPFLKSESIDRIKGFEKVSNLYNVPFEPIEDSEIMTLSRAAIDDYLTCPFKYQLIHVTPIRIVANTNVAYGNAIHNTIGEYYKLKSAKKPVSPDQLLGWFDTFWDESGFLSRTHERLRYEQGRKALKRFYQEAEKSPLPKYVEKEFKIKVDKNIIKGRYDAVFEKDGKPEVVDFKTSNVKDQKKADERTRQSTQLAMYALAWYENTGVLPESVKLQFIDTGLVGSHTPTEKGIEKTRANIIEAARGIRSRDYQAKPSLGSCGYCPFSLYCPVAVRTKISE